jgi:hypothetical protein
MHCEPLELSPPNLRPRPKVPIRLHCHHGPNGIVRAIRRSRRRDDSIARGKPHTSTLCASRSTPTFVCSTAGTHKRAQESRPRKRLGAAHSTRHAADAPRVSTHTFALQADTTAVSDVGPRHHHDSPLVDACAALLRAAPPRCCRRAAAHRAVHHRSSATLHAPAATRTPTPESRRRPFPAQHLARS